MAEIPLLCLSSSSTPRYRLDVLRALALPMHSVLQYRYSADIVETDLHGTLTRNELVGSVVLLAHVDCQRRRDTDRAHVTPIRRAVLQKSQRLGNYFIIKFSLWGYAVVDDLAVFQSVVPAAGPHWTNGETDGLWCLKVTDHKGWRHETGLDAFQSVTGSLCTIADFRSQPFFVAIDGLFERGSDVRIKGNEHGEFAIAAGSNFDLSLFHFHPDHDHQVWDARIASIEVETTKPLLSTVTNPRLAVDSPYDLKTVSFKAAESVGLAKYGDIVVRAVAEPPAADPRQPELVLPIRIDAAWARTIAQVGGLSLLLFLQQYVGASASEEVSAVRAVVLAVLAVATAIVAVFAIKTPD